MKTQPTYSTNEAISGIAAFALQIAQGQIGQRETPTGSNRGEMVDEYLRSVGLSPGYAWCQAFVYWCFAEAAELMKTTNPVVRTAGVCDCWNKTRTRPDGFTTKWTSSEVIAKPSILCPGDQFIMALGKGTGHTGIVEWIVTGTKGKPTFINTIEGNSNGMGSREGYAVVRQKRDINNKTILGYIRYR